MYRNNSNWIWTQDWTERNNGEPVIVMFRKKYKNAGQIKLSANCRYKLYINGQFVQEGPQKGTVYSAYKDPADIRQFTISYDGSDAGSGENICAVEVLYYPIDPGKRNDSLYYSPYPCLYVEDEIGHELDGAEGWKYAYADHIKVVGEDFTPAPIHGSEVISGEGAYHGWKEAAYDDSGWFPAKPYSFFDSRKAMAPFDLEDRNIPAMLHEKGQFDRVVCFREPADQTEEILTKQWNSMLHGEAHAEISPDTTLILEISAGELICGYPLMKLTGGEGACIRVIYAESYGIPQPDKLTPSGLRKMPPLKQDRCDFQSGQIMGIEDSYRPAGCGTVDDPEVFETFLFRTFRFIRLEIITKKQGMSICSYDYLSTGYPLEVRNHPVSDREDYNRIWDISLRTLKRCMHETYVDCPYYEQLQYAMDSRAEILFTYEVSGDDRLARNCMDSFRKTQRPDGMIQACAPAAGVNVIPGFAIFYIMMVHDHMTYFQDVSLVKDHISCIDGILRYFENHLTEKGLVGSVGGVLFQHRYWSFIDWCIEWDETIGVPAAGTLGDRSITMESLLYIYGLRCAADLSVFAGRPDVARVYSDRADTVVSAVRKHCISENGLIQDGPGLELFSTHCQVWGILDEILDVDQGRKNLRNTYRQAGIPQCSVAMSFYLFLAFEKLGMLDTPEFDRMWDPWRNMLSNHMTTCVENTTDERSDCHAWGATMLYALPRIQTVHDE